MDTTAKEQVINEGFYDDQNTWRWYCIMCGADYTGIGHYDKAEVVKNENGKAELKLRFVVE